MWLLLLRRLVRAKFGGIPGWFEDKLGAGKPKDFERWAERILTAETVEAVFDR